MARHIDPVCGMEIDGANAVAKEKVGGKPRTVMTSIMRRRNGLMAVSVMAMLLSRVR